MYLQLIWVKHILREIMHIVYVIEMYLNVSNDGTL